jgi:hypothetical protein
MTGGSSLVHYYQSSFILLFSGEAFHSGVFTYEITKKEISVSMTILGATRQRINGHNPAKLLKMLKS